MSEGVVDYEGDEIRFGMEAAALSYGSGCTSNDECDEAWGEDCRNSPDCPGDGFKGECCGDGVCEKFESKRGTSPEDCP